MFARNEQISLDTGEIWIPVRDANPTVRSVFDRHYSRHFRNGESSMRFCGPGEKIVLVTPCAKAIFVWRRQSFTLDGQKGVNCSVFRNEGAGQSSDLIAAAVLYARAKWPQERLYTYVDASQVASPNPGYCFKKAGWTVCGKTKKRGLIVLEYL